MPNWVKNILEIKGPKSKRIMKSLMTGENFDFNNIIKMPEELNIISGTYTDTAVSIYLTSLNPEITYLGRKNKSKKTFEEVEKLTLSVAFTKFRKDIPEKELENKDVKQYIKDGKHAVENIRKHGVLDWYGWCTKNWGTKWNAAYTTLIKANKVEFDTAWEGAHKIVNMLSEKYPKNTFYHSFAEEFLGNYVGYEVFKDGELIGSRSYEDNTKKAFKFACKIWNIDIKNIFKYGRKEKRYVPK